MDDETIKKFNAYKRGVLFFSILYVIGISVAGVSLYLIFSQFDLYPNDEHYIAESEISEYVAKLNHNSELTNVIENQTENTISESTIPENNSNLAYSYALSKRTDLQAERYGHVEIIIDTEGNAYLHVIGGSDSISDASIKANLKKVEEKYATYSPKGYADEGNSTELIAYKLDITDALSVYNVTMGNGGFNYFVIVREGGKISYVSYDKLAFYGEIEVHNVEGLESVVSIVNNTYTMTPYAINTKGEEISLYDYLK